MIVDNLFDTIKRGMLGYTKGLSTGLPKLDKLTYGIQQGWMTLVGADTGAGKSSLVLYTTIYNAYKSYIKDPSIPIKFLIFSFEMSAEALLAKMLSMHIYDTYKKVLPYSDILSFNETLSEEDFQMVEKSKTWLTGFTEIATIVDKPVTASGLYGICKEWCKTLGTITQVSEHKEEFTPFNDKQIPIVVLDHIGLMDISAGKTKKDEMDIAAKHLIYFRNKYKFCVYLIQQLNRNFKQMDRRKSEHAFIQLDDFEQSSGPTHAAEIVIGIYHPYREKNWNPLGYDVRQLKDRSRILICLKNRYGQADKALGVVFYGETGIWKELPQPDQINDYSIYLNP